MTRVRAGRAAGATPAPAGPRTVEWRRPWLYAAQERALFHEHRYGLVEASTKAGKTVGCMAWYTEQAALRGRPGREFWWVAPVYGQAEIAYRRMKRSLGSTFVRWVDGRLVGELANGAVLRFKSAEKPDNLYGEDVWAAVFDEGSRAREAAWVALRSTLTATRGPVRIIGNVKGRRNWMYQLARRAEAGEPGYHYAKITAWDAVEGGILEREEVEDAQRTLAPDVFGELYLCEPTDDGANPFGLRVIDAAVQATLAPGPVAVYGVDLARARDWSVIVGLNAAGRTAYFARFQRPWAETIAVLRSRIGSTPAWVDATGVGDPVVELARRHEGPIEFTPAGQFVVNGCPAMRGFVFTSRSKQHLLESYAAWLQRGEIGLGPDDAVRVEHEAFEYQHTRNGVRYSGPAGMHDDCVMAYALAAWGLKMTPKPMGGALVTL